jgi:hypothetical protein
MEAHQRQWICEAVGGIEYWFRCVNCSLIFRIILPFEER